MSETLVVEIKNSLLEVHRLARLVDDFGRRHQIEARFIYNMKLALDEVLTNIISYGYDDDREHGILTRLAVEQGHLTAEVEDDAKPFNPLNTPQANTKQSLDERQIGGLGIHLVRKLIDELEYRRHNDKNILVMRMKMKGT